MYELIIIRVKNHHIPATILVEIALNESTVLIVKNQHIPATILGDMALQWKYLLILEFPLIQDMYIFIVFILSLKVSYQVNKIT